jgi:thioredoxin 1
VDDEGDLAQQFGIPSIPTLILFKDGKAVTTMIGAKPKADIIGEITPYL